MMANCDARHFKDGVTFFHMYSLPMKTAINFVLFALQSIYENVTTMDTVKCIKLQKKRHV